MRLQADVERGDVDDVGERHPGGREHVTEELERLRELRFRIGWRHAVGADADDAGAVEPIAVLHRGREVQPVVEELHASRNHDVGNVHGESSHRSA